MTDSVVIYGISAAAISSVIALAVVHAWAPSPHPAAQIVATDSSDEPTGPKGDREPILAHRIRTIPMTRTDAVPVVAPVITPPAPLRLATAPARGPAATRTLPKLEIDVCARHGGHRVDDPARRKWHCVFTKRGNHGTR